MAARQRARRARAASRSGAGHDIVVVGASAGGVEATRELLSGVPPDLDASIFIVIHVGPASPGHLPKILARECALPVTAARDGEPIRRRRVYVAPADHHLLIEGDHTRVVRGPRENRHRPAIDPLFRSAAWAHRSRVVGVVLTGTLEDGTAGLWAVKRCGGVAVVQDPADALFPDMPANAVANVEVDHVLPLSGIAAQITKLASQPARRKSKPPAAIEIEQRFASMGGGMSDLDRIGTPSRYSCPACHGTLWEVRQGPQIRYRCHTGHAFGPLSLDSAQRDDTDLALDIARRSLQERSERLQRVARAQRGARRAALRARTLAKVEELQKSAQVLERLIARE
jgi:two-component system chemotaxis response regulator CheB